MKNILTITALTIAMSFFSTTAVFAQEDSTQTKYGFWDNMTNIFNKSKEELQNEFQNKTPLETAQEQGMTKEQFQDKVRVLRKARLEEKVKAGYLTQAEADERIAHAEERMANCDGTGNRESHQYGNGRGNGNGFGREYRMNQ